MKMHDLLKVDSCVRGIRIENMLMASLPPINEIDHKLHENLIDTMEKRIQVENQYLEVTLPGAVDAIKLDSIPAVYVYGRDGALLKRFDGSSGESEGVSYEKQVIPFVGDLVQRDPAK